MKRPLVALILIPLLILYIMKLPVGWYVALLLISGLIAQSEFYSMYGVRGGLRHGGLLLGAALIGAYYAQAGFVAEVLVLSFLLLASFRLFIKRDTSGALRDISPAVMGLIYIPGLLGLQVNIRRLGPEWIVFLWGAIWLSDSMAYYIGTYTGKKKLYEEVSPKKTWAGAVGSVLGGVAGSVILRGALGIEMPLLTVSALGASLGAVSVLGDLVESMFKRDAGVKDSGRLLPGGHGGLLDKIDSALFAGPVLYWMLIGLGVI